MKESDTNYLFFSILVTIMWVSGLVGGHIYQGARLSALETRVEYLEIMNENQIRD